MKLSIIIAQCHNKINDYSQNYMYASYAIQYYFGESLYGSVKINTDYFKAYRENTKKDTIAFHRRSA